MGLLDPALRSATVLLMASVTKYVPRRPAYLANGTFAVRI